ncbi:CPBP family intramembrane glutamic endopeptidase [Geomicrobium sp. JCM 19038]|uniref:CPBP family intramembrane glutamic endopeptidase n=1 Tax=Geomicrobium sp. JCM 19038 TaxID=1460635 RepID=UPI00045F12DB|nr:CPBP family intramembrane glutamic endopeptidase [Geomicrobium sp. JCM 19038]GAK08233.1 possible membrane associated protease [Geomicrobium sp. JCM 19038]
MIVIFAPLFEEVFLRGALQETLTRRYGKNVAILLGACIFVLIHALLIVLAPAYFLFGFFLGFLYYRYQSIYAPLLFHVFINLVNVLTVFFVTVL